MGMGLIQVAVMLTRAGPPLPQARLSANGQLTEIRATDLRLTTNEAGAFLNNIMGMKLSAQEVAVLDVRTEGWIARLLLAALSTEPRYPWISWQSHPFISKERIGL